ncbi:ATP-dependent endonuclease [Paraburkholderia sp. 22B1P]|uniref:ATP-dependent nuclease n=1 Tax=Paraburkholderia sp. 22B1P TaxID=3080498 RepID=UPI00308FFBDE|nr:ATP-dependent endonuclease [Paraburkholderia sp. 22B1P]
MHLEKLGIRNFRRLRDVVIDLAPDISIFVGANNSGKTSAGHALQLFTGKGRFSLHDFSAELWPQFVAFGEGVAGATLPTMSIDIWLHIDGTDIHRVIDLLPSLAWQGALVGMRIAYMPIDPEATKARYTEMRRRALAAVAREDGQAAAFDPAPRNLHDFLREDLNKEYELRYYVLDPARFAADMIADADYVPVALMPSENRSGREILNSLIRVDFLHAQRHLSDSPGGARAEDLSRVLSRFYERNLEQKEDDLDVLRALANSEAMLNDHLERVFEPTLRSLATLGYPGLSNPRLMIRSALDPAAIMSDRGARVHYALGDAEEQGIDPPTLPDHYNGLGFKNLIFMVVELLDLHAQWLAIDEGRPPLHLIFIEEPEAHLHAQLQQAFIRKVLDILQLQGEDRRHYSSQVVVTTHSSHILYERGFRPIRYFRRSQTGNRSEILSLSAFYVQTSEGDRNFLERYLKLTHCDLFFADAAVLVEGNVERLLLPQMIEIAAPKLQSTYLSILEVGGAFGHRFKPLIDFLGLTALIVTDLDSVVGPPAPDVVAGDPQEAALLVGADGVDNEGRPPEEDDADDEGDEDEEGGARRAGKACLPDLAGAVTSNQTLIQWLPRRRTIADLFAVTPVEKIQPRAGEGTALVRVAYQCRTAVTWGEETLQLAGRTLEEAFALENLPWCQANEQRDLGLRIPGAAGKDLSTLAERVHKRVKGSSFKKTDFALGLLGHQPDAWRVPTYIAEGLVWLEGEILPQEQPEEPVGLRVEEAR